MFLMRHFYQLLVCCFCIQIFSQDIVAKKGSYGIDKKNKVIIWHESNLDSVNAIHNSKISISFNDTFKMTHDDDKLSYKKSYVFNHDGADYHLYITKLPLVHITLDSTILNSQKKHLGIFTYYNKKEYVESSIGIRQRGNLSLTFPKKSYDIEFRNDTISKTSKDLKFLGMRSDDDWVLDGLYNEPLNMRSTVATKLWLKLHEPHYISKEPNAKSGFDVGYVELFRNNEYRGLYALSEQVDRKLLKLVKNEAEVVHGELFKANSYEGGPAFKKSGAYNNLFPHYLGFRMEYPVIDYNSYWNNLSELLELVVNQSDNDFINTIEKHIDITNAIDYYIFINVLFAGDNMGKNYYLGKYDKNEPYFFIPWDLDSSFGNVQEGKRLTNTSDILSNGLFDRLLSLNPNQYIEKLKLRWKSLRSTTISNAKVMKQFDSYYNRFTDEKVYERNQKVWSKKVLKGDDYKFLVKWFNNRMIALDAYFESL